MPNEYAAVGRGATGAAAVIVPGHSGRQSCIVKNNHATETFYVSTSAAVDASTGFPVAAGESFIWNGVADLYAFSTGAGTYAYIEVR